MTVCPFLPLSDIAIIDWVALTCLGGGRAAHVDALRSGRSGLSACDFPAADIPCFIGRVPGIEERALPERTAPFDNRATRLALAALEEDGFESRVREAIGKWGGCRVGIVLGTSTSGLERLEQAYRARRGNGPLAAEYSIKHHSDHHAVTTFVAEHLGIEGIAYSVSTACSSAAKALVDGAQLTQLGLCDAVLVGGVDSLCLTTLYGFEALELVSRAPCRPFDVERSGVSIGEGAGFLLLERNAEGLRLLGYGESSDAVSMSTPPEDGAGAAAAMQEALHKARISPEEVSFVKLHGTATHANDAAEGAAVGRVFGSSVPAGALKGMIGHTLGAAGAIEAIICMYAMREGIIPGTIGLSRPDPEIGLTSMRNSATGRLQNVLCNAFGFGGSNNSILLGQS